MGSRFSQAQHDALAAALAQGVTTVEHNGKRVRYASLKDMLMLLDVMETDLASQPPALARKLAHRSVFFKS